MSEKCNLSWVADIGETAVIRDADGNQVAIFTHMNTRTGGRRASDEVARSTRIAAAAPELLEALKAITPLTEECAEELQASTWSPLVKAIKAARAAIDKAGAA